MKIVQFELNFSSGNAAFEESPELEVQSILQHVQDCIRDGTYDGIVKDYNGNSIGTWSLGVEEEI